MSKRPLSTVAITGASGFLGAALTSYFLNRNWQVVALVRNPPKSNDERLTYKKYDIYEDLSTEALEGVDYVVHAAYIKRDREHPDAFQANIEGAERLLRAARDAKTKKNIFISSMSAHDDAISLYGRQKLAIEELFNAKTDVNLRLGLIIGNGGIVGNMADFMRRMHVVPLIGNGQQPLQIINVNNVGVVIEHTITYDISGTLTVATPEVYSYKDFYKALARRLSIRVLFVPIPVFILLSMTKVAEVLHLPTAVNSDSVQGLQKLISVETKEDLKKLHVELDSLQLSLQQTKLDKNSGKIQ